MGFIYCEVKVKSYKSVEVGGLYETNNFGVLEVLSVNSSVKATVRFVKTGYTTEAELGSIRSGQVRDWSNSLRERIGEVLPTTMYGDVTVLEWKDSYNVKIVFNNTGTVAWHPAGNICKGKVMDYMAPIASGVGYIGYGDYSPKANPKAYKHWIHMIKRCNSDEYEHRNYFDVSVCTEWLCFQNFAPWAEKQTGFNNKAWQLDKDILAMGNREYGPNVCCFVPARINSLIIRSNPDGKAEDKFGTIYFTVRNASGKKLNKSFKDRDEGKLWYKETKELIVKEVADQYKNELDSSVYEALYSWQVN